MLCMRINIQAQTHMVAYPLLLGMTCHETHHQLLPIPPPPSSSFHFNALLVHFPPSESSALGSFVLPGTRHEKEVSFRHVQHLESNDNDENNYNNNNSSSEMQDVGLGWRRAEGVRGNHSTRWLQRHGREKGGGDWSLLFPPPQGCIWFSFSGLAVQMCVSWVKVDMLCFGSSFSSRCFISLLLSYPSASLRVESVDSSFHIYTRCASWTFSSGSRWRPPLSRCIHLHWPARWSFLPLSPYRPCLLLRDSDNVIIPMDRSLRITSGSHAQAQSFHRVVSHLKEIFARRMGSAGILAMTMFFVERVRIERGTILLVQRIHV